MKDSANYVDHLNGKKHQKLLGLSVRTKRSSLEEVQMRMREKKRETEKKTDYNYDERVSELRRLEEEEKGKKKEMKKRRRDSVSDDDEEDADRKRHRKDNDAKDTKHDYVVQKNNSEHGNDDKKQEKSEILSDSYLEPAITENEDNDQEEADVDPVMEAMVTAMGLPVNFGGSKKT